MRAARSAVANRASAEFRFPSADAGDGVAASLAEKTCKIRHVFISRADRNHVVGLLQLHQLIAEGGRPSIHFPKDSGSFPALREFMEKFDPQSGPATWVPLSPNQSISISPKYSALATPSAHIETTPEKTKALAYTVVRSSRMLREER